MTGIFYFSLARVNNAFIKHSTLNVVNLIQSLDFKKANH